jgi:hypothetical protein
MSEERLFYILPDPGTDERLRVTMAVSALVRQSLDTAFWKFGIRLHYHAFYKVNPGDADDNVLDHTSWEIEQFRDKGFESTVEWVRSDRKYTLITWTSKEYGNRLRCTLFDRETNDQLRTVELRRDRFEDQLSEMVKEFRQLINTPE